MEIKDLTIDESLWVLKCPYEMDDVWGVCVHNTYNTAPAINEYTYMVGNGKYTGWHWRSSVVSVMNTDPPHIVHLIRAFQPPQGFVNC